ncbi:hypothetical protein V1525DRAFT_187045 [Lipomyces kononenkoae]|uniref:Uncharacterized protein n=1 Tax=Lipomyces kononenkoae TaxID=34357 RepID=A0ACC3SZA1_LIPKO
MVLVDFVGSQVLNEQNELHALDQLSYFPEADNSLRYTAHRGGSSLFSYNFSISSVSDQHVSLSNSNADGEILSISSETTPMDVVCVRNDDNLTISDRQTQENSNENHPPTPSESDLLVQLSAQLQEKVEQSDMLRLLALKGYYQHRLRGAGKMEASLKVAEHIYNRHDYTARLVRRWAKWFELTGILPPASLRGKHTMHRSAVCDEDVKRKCIQFFRNSPQNKRTVQAQQSFYENTLYPEISGSFTKSKISERTVAAYLHSWGFSIGRHSKDVYFDGHERNDVVEYRKGHRRGRA